MTQQETPGRALEKVLRGVAGEPLVVLLTGHPDPDAIGSALAHQRFCQAVGVPATIAHIQSISHRQNRALVKLLNVEMIQVKTAAELRRFRHLSLVDTSHTEPTIELPAELRLLTVVDHHRAATVEAPFVDIRTGMGASASMYAEYMQQGFAPLTGAGRADARVATALLFGVQSDTDDFALATPADFMAAAYLKQYCDVEALRRIGRRVIGAAAMDAVGRALAGIMVVRDFAIAGVGELAVGDRDTIGGAADYILQREDIDTVLVYGLVGDRIDGSLRTNSASVDPAAFLETAFGRGIDGRPYGGGRADKGGFQVPLGPLADCDDRGVLWHLIEQVVCKRIALVVPGIEREFERRWAGTAPHGPAR